MYLTYLPTRLYDKTLGRRCSELHLKSRFYGAFLIKISYSARIKFVQFCLFHLKYTHQEYGARRRRTRNIMSTKQKRQQLD